MAGQAVQDVFQPPPHRARIFALTAWGLFCGQMGLSIIAPFFPKEAKSRDVNAAVLGWIFSIFEVAVLLGTPLAMRTVVAFGSKSMLVAGNALGGLGNILLGLCWYINGSAAFTGAALVMRVIAGFAFAFNSTPAYGLLPYLYGPDVSSASGTLEGVNGLAMILGPVIGASLFSLGGGEQHLGFVVPFMVLGGIELACAVGNLLALPKLPAPASEQPSLAQFSWKVAVPCLICVVTGANLGLLGPTLEPHLSEAPLSYSVQYVGVVFAVACAVYAVMAPLVGMLDDWQQGRQAFRIMAFGAAVSGTGYATIAPAESFGLGPELTAAECWTGICLIGAGCAFGMIPIYKQTLSCALHDEPEERELATAAMFTMSLSIGSFLGPTAGGMLSHFVGVRTTYTGAGFMLLALAALLLGISFHPAFRPRAAGRDQPLMAAGQEIPAHCHAQA